MRSTTPAILSAAIDVAQIVGHRRAKRDQFDHAALGLRLKLVELLVGLDQLARRRFVALDEAAHRFLDRRFGEQPMSLIRPRSSARSWSKAFSVCPCGCCICSLRSAVAAGDVVLRPLDWGLVKICEVSPTSISSPRWKKAVRCDTRAACCMLWVTMTIVNALAKLVDQLLDLGGRDRVERRGRLVEEDDFGPHGERAGDAQPLLLPARQRQARWRRACP